MITQSWLQQTNPCLSRSWGLNQIRKEVYKKCFIMSSLTQLAQVWKLLSVVKPDGINPCWWSVTSSTVLLEKQLSCLRRCHKPSKTLTLDQYLRPSTGGLQVIHSVISESVNLHSPCRGTWAFPPEPEHMLKHSILCFMSFSYRSGLWPSLWCGYHMDIKIVSLVSEPVGGDIFLFLFFLSLFLPLTSGNILLTRWKNSSQGLSKCPVSG